MRLWEICDYQEWTTKIQEKKNWGEMRTNLKRPPMLLFSDLWMDQPKHFSASQMMFSEGNACPGTYFCSWTAQCSYKDLSLLSFTVCAETREQLDQQKVPRQKVCRRWENAEGNAKSPESVIWYILQASLRREWVWSFCRLYAVLITKVL